MQIWIPDLCTPVRAFGVFFPPLRLRAPSNLTPDRLVSLSLSFLLRLMLLLFRPLPLPHRSLSLSLCFSSSSSNETPSHCVSVVRQQSILCTVYSVKSCSLSPEVR